MVRLIANVSKPLRLGLVAFLTAAIGATVGFSLGDSYRPGNPLALMAFLTVVIGVAMGFFAVVWGWVGLMRHSAKSPVIDKPESN